MKYLKLFLLLFTFSIYGQTWQSTSISPNANGQRFDDVFFLTDDIGWAANGYYAAVYKTIDGGLTWTEQLNESMLGGNYYFRNIEFLNTNIGFLGTLNGKVFSTNDGGTNWNEIINISPNPAAICGFTTVGTNTVYGCGAYFSPAYIIKSTDSGATWDYIDMSAYANALVEIKFLTEDTGYACGSSSSGAVILKTTDGGTSWSEIYNSNITGEYVWKLQILEDNPDVFFGAISSISPFNGKLISSLDNGTTWNSYDAPETDIQAVGFINENQGWMGGHTTGFYETLNGGQTWTNLNVGSNLNRIFIVNSSLAYASGTSIYKFTDEILDTHNLTDNPSKSLNIQLHNNPVTSVLEFSIYFPSSDNMLIELYDSKGSYIRQLSRESIKTNDVKKNYSFPVDDLQAGIYLINFHNNFQRQSLKFVKQ
ncbi:YCF48-related protein [Xanthomarina sp. F2636L]|uniref:YCF48-related protein n=1 Tax=Xanthomarina sp. F2636L TaxID=2996018 RepID=UPI00225E1742|nr:T9SS type A sorting domain-containing protein [Xanthomarina sp. F2636L]MCX7551996.1 YCF48-related protein [Xanthomarina sp. F2636L]